MTADFQKASRYRARFGEGPLFDHRINFLYWVDIEGKKIIAKDLHDGSEQLTDCPDLVSSIQLAKEPHKLFATIRHRVYSVDLLKNQFLPIAQVETELDGNRFNDGKCDALGRYWAGTMNFDLSSATGALYKVDLDGTITRQIDALAISNGLAWSSDNTKMYLIDTPTLNIFSFDFNLEEGRIQNRSVCISFNGETGRPDGMTIDSEGMLWVAHARGGRVSRWNPDEGKKLEEYELPVKATTSLAFGGKDLSTLFVTTAFDPFKEDLAGYVYALAPGVKGTESKICRVQT